MPLQNEIRLGAGWVAGLHTSTMVWYKRLVPSTAPLQRELWDGFLPAAPEFRFLINGLEASASNPFFFAGGLLGDWHHPDPLAVHA